MQRSDWDPDWDRIKEICELVMQRPYSERTAFIADACQHDPALISEVKSLLDHHDASANGSAPPLDKLIGTTIDERYFIERELDQGAIGRVYLAVDRRLEDRPVVIKVLLEASLRNPNVVQRFKQEAVALSRITDPGVVGILDAGELAEGTPYIVMQYVEGQTLRQQIPPEGMDLQHVARILEQIGDALEHVHEKGIFHRDLKPENILIERGTESVKIVDFGVAKVTDSTVAPSTVNQALIGTVAYMSPERLRGEPGTAASDIYSVAVIAYEMITGLRPFNAKSPAQLLEMQRHGVRSMRKDLRPYVSRKARSILLRALSFRPRHRYKSAREFGEALASAVLQPVVEVRSKKWIVAAVVALVSLGIYLSISLPPPPPLAHRLDYWLTVQKMGEETEFQGPYNSAGEEIFANGDKFRLNVSSREPGYLYVFNEGPPEPGKTSFNMIYPNHSINNGSASVGANQPIQSSWITFRGPAGTENFWIVWSVSPVSELESAKNQTFNYPNVGLNDQNLGRVKEFLRVRQSENKAKTTRYKSRQAAVVRGTGDMFITFVELKHR